MYSPSKKNIDLPIVTTTTTIHIVLEIVFSLRFRSISIAAVHLKRYFVLETKSIKLFFPNGQMPMLGVVYLFKR